jgi:hypothetical protein
LTDFLQESPGKAAGQVILPDIMKSAGQRELNSKMLTESINPVPTAANPMKISLSRKIIDLFAKIQVS